MRQLVIAAFASVFALFPVFGMANNLYNHRGQVTTLAGPGTGGCAQFTIRGDPSIYFLYEEDPAFSYNWHLLDEAAHASRESAAVVSFRTGTSPTPPAAAGCIAQGFVYVPKVAF